MEQDYSKLNITPDIFNPTDVYEVKILLAYFLFQMDRPVTPNQLTEIATGDGIVNYFLYSEAVSEMLENKTLTLEEQEGTSYYLLTEKGREGAQSFKKLVSKSVRDRIYAAGLRFFAKLKAEHDVSFEIVPAKKGYSVHCTCEDNGLVLMDMTLYAPDREQAEYIKSKIMMNPTDFYCRVMDYVIENEEYVPSVSDDY
ncbi:DUF4364 family protein [Ruminococcus sp. Marseille-P6503]|uniref:DUF4364 family protein n=1 Tax=Ruminococcus sp. Marseille-P6503 TaxID=2364796 RepID=UPI001FAAB382|nr:DUF4364 family protein [Ruminococcus sp. Marseille-P6503]